MRFITKKVACLILSAMAFTTNAAAQTIHNVAPGEDFTITDEMINEGCPDPCINGVYHWWSRTADVRGYRLVMGEVAAPLTIPDGTLAPNQVYVFVRDSRCDDCGPLIHSPKVLVQVALSAPTGTGAAICGIGTVNISASAAGAAIDWYDQATDGTLLLSNSNSYTTPSISATTTYYAEARNISTGLPSATRTAVVATVNDLPANPTGIDGARCGDGAIDISASADGAVIDWYDQATGGSPLQSGSNDFTTPSLSATTTYYAEARNATTGCVSVLRTAVTAVVAKPDVPSPPTQNGPSCVGTGVTFSAVAPSGATGLDWEGSVSGTGTSKTTATTAGTYQARVRSYITANGVTCYSDYSAYTSGTIGTPAASGQPSNFCGCAAGLQDCSGTCMDDCVGKVWTRTGCPGVTRITTAISQGVVLWGAANTSCASLGAGWRLPTIACLSAMYSSGEQFYSRGNGNSWGYWSSEAYNANNHNAWSDYVYGSWQSDWFSNATSKLNFKCVKIP
jgi:hypothetical protein